MGFEPFKESYTGKTREVTLGGGKKTVTVGGKNCYPFYLFEGQMTKKPVLAMEVWDMKPTEWPEAATAHVADVLDDPVAWAKKCVEKFGAELIVLQLKSTDPNDKNAPAAEAAATVKKVAKALNVPLVVWGCANPKKDEEVLKKVAEECDGMNLTIGPVEDKNHKAVGAAAMAFKHSVISSSPIDVNLAKQVNILLENLGVPLDKVVIDPTTGGLGYGLEYSYSVMERLGMAALTQGDEKLQCPVINNLGNEIWKCKEAKLPAADDPMLGDPEKRGIMMESVAAVCYLLAGSDIVVVRHPESLRLAKAYINLLTDGGSAKGIAGIEKKLDLFEPDYAALAPKPDLTIAEKAAAPKPAEKKPAAAEKKPAAAAAPKKEEKKVEAAPAAAPKAAAAPAAPAAKPVEEDKAAQEAKAKAEAAAKAKEEAEAKAKAEAAAKAKAEADAKAKAEEEEKKRKAEIAKRDAEEQELRNKRRAEAEDRAKSRGASAKKQAVSKTAAAQQRSALDRLIDNLARVHRW